MKRPRAASKDMSAARLDEPLSERVRRDLPSYTAAERRVAQSLLSDYPVAGLETVARFATRAGTSGPTILRFVSRLGLKSYAEFQNRLRGEVHERLQSPLARYPSLRSSGEGGKMQERVGLAQCRNIERAVRSVTPKEYAAITELVCDRRRKIFCLGGRFTQMLAAYFHHCLRELRPGVRLVQESSASWADYLLDVQRGDVLVVFDFRRYQRDVLEFASGAATQGADIVLITDVWNSPIAAQAAYVIGCPVEMPTAFDSAVGGLAMAEVVVAGAVERLGGRAKKRIETLEALRRPFNLESALSTGSRKPEKNRKRRGLAS
jgi:DNA-binding MurR/RpiR family transcriptional regulator